MARHRPLPTDPMQLSLLLALPAELRFMILELLLVRNGIVLRRYGTRPSNAADFTTILRVCKQIHHEGCQIFYRENMFRFLAGSLKFTFSRQEIHLDRRIAEHYGQLVEKVATFPLHLKVSRHEDALGDLAQKVQLMFSKMAKVPAVHVLRIDMRVADESGLRCLMKVVGGDEMKSKLAAWMISQAKVPKRLRIHLDWFHMPKGGRLISADILSLWEDALEMAKVMRPGQE